MNLRPHSLRRVAAASIASLSLIGLAACGSDEPETTETTASSEPAPAESEETAAASGDQPDWATPLSTPGEKIATAELGDVTVDVYQVGIEKATETGNFADPETNKPLVAEGDDLVFVNYVVTNNGDDIDLGSSLASVDARYENWPYMQGMDGITDDELYAKLKINDGGIEPGKNNDPAIYTLAKGQSFSFGENFKYEKGEKITFEVTMTPVDSKGVLVHDDRAEAEATGTIK